MIRMPKFHLNAHNFGQNRSNLIKLTFLDSSRQDLSNDIYYDWFFRGPHFPIVFGNYLITTSFLLV